MGIFQRERSIRSVVLMIKPVGEFSIKPEGLTDDNSRISNRAGMMKNGLNSLRYAVKSCRNCKYDSDFYGFF